MAKINWEYLHTIDATSLQDEEVEKLFPIIASTNIEDENEVDRLKHLFNITRAVLQFKAMQAEVAAEELELFAERESTASALREQTLRAQIDDLRRQLVKQQGFSSSISKSPSNMTSREAEQLEEIRYLKKENESLHQELFELEKKFKEEKADFEKQQQMFEDYEKEKRDMRREIGNLKEEIQYYRQQLETQHQDVSSAQQNSDFNSADIIKGKNIQIYKLLEQIEMLEDSNDQLEKNLMEMKLKLEDGSKEMETMSADYFKIKNALQKSDRSLNRLKQENKNLAERLDELTKIHHQKEVIEERALINVNQRIATLQEILQNKDTQIESLQKQLADDKRILHVNAPDSSSNEAILKTLQLKDEQIYMLQKEINNITYELQRNAELLDTFKNNSTKPDNNQWKLKFEQLQLLLKQSEEQISILKKQLYDSDIYALQKDKEFTTVYARLKEYEQGEYGLSEAVAEIKDVRSQLKVRDRQIEDLTHKLNHYELLVNDPSFGSERKHHQTNNNNGQSANLIREKDETIIKLEKMKTVLLQDIANLNSRREQLKEEINFHLQTIKQCQNQLQTPPDDMNRMSNHMNKFNKDELNITTAKIVTSKIVTDKNVQTEIELSEPLIFQTNETFQSHNSEKTLSTNQGRLLRRYKKLLSVSKNSESSDLKIMQLNTHLVHVLKQLKTKTEQIQKLEEKLVEYKNKFPIVIHQIGLLYSEYLKGKDQWLKDKEKLETDYLNLKTNMEISSVKLKAYESLLEDLQKDDSELKQRIGEVNRNSVLLKSEYIVLNQRYQMCKENEVKLQKENNKLQTQLLEFETSVMEKVSFLKQQNEMNEYKISMLQSKLDKSLPKKDFEEVNKQLLDVTSKYHQILQNQSWIYSQDKYMLQENNKKLCEMNKNSIMEELKKEKEKNKSLEYLLKEFTEKDFLDNETDNHTKCLKEKIILKIKAVNEEQRSTTANQMYQCENEIVQHLTKRIHDLEAKVEELIKINLEQQKQDFDLQEKFQDCISPSVHKTLLQKLEELQESEAELRKDYMKEKSTAKIAYHQVHALERINESLKKEIEILKIENITDDVVRSKNSEIEANYKKQLLESEKANSLLLSQMDKIQYQIPQLERLCLALEKKCCSKDEEIFSLRSKYRDKVYRLEKLIHHLHRQLIGIIPLDKEERLMNRILCLQEEKRKLVDDIEKAESRVSNAETKLVELELRNHNLEECYQTMKLGNHLEKVVELQQTIVEMKLNEVKQNRKNELLQLEISHQNILLKHQEDAVSQLEEQISKMHQNMYINEVHPTEK